MRIFTHSFQITGILCALLLASCESAPKYAAVKSSQGLAPKPGKALVLIYWDSSFFTGDLGNFNIYASRSDAELGNLITSKLGKGKFYSLDVEPGYHKFTGRHVVSAGSVVAGLMNLAYATPLSLHPKPSVLTMWGKGEFGLGVQSGQTYYINAHWLRLKDHLELHGVTEQQAWSQLSNCRWLNPH